MKHMWRRRRRRRHFAAAEAIAESRSSKNGMQKRHLTTSSCLILHNRMDASKEERISGRRLRIQQKLAMKQGDGAAGSTGAAIIMHEKTDVRIGKCARSR